ncbi:Coiled-coil-helix-coiled-coil-helix domain-containing protein 1 [Frankliniella fusca]|uniref:Coiled-coil-helix-coiled-coil-helix domain-containing protein 1 n=1 Tax=Frankliniella fusca TaxID=407009 RepID=A0AAE1HZ58_9NEOP|nr:Coiled-coil-helix-coiled-coil-helix domain-containing protein 1 [Frankliniella fusca]
MRATQVLNRRWAIRLQYEQSYNIPFQDLHPLALKDRYEVGQRSDSGRPCVGQLAILLQCFKDTDFNQKRCADSLKAYYACIEEYNARQTSSVKDRKLSDVKRVRDLTLLEGTKLLKQKPLKAK